MNNAESETSETENPKKPPGGNFGRVVAAINSVTNEIKTQNAEANKGQEWSRRTAIAAICYTGLTAVILLTGVYQAYLNRQQVKLTQQEFAVAQRAFVSIDIANPVPALDNSGKFIGFALEVSFKNNGNTATKDMHDYVTCQSSPTPMKEPWPLINKGQTPQGGDLPFLLAPHDSTSSGCVVSTDTLEQVQAHHLNGYIFATVRYFDRLDETTPHVTELELTYSDKIKVSDPSDPATPSVPLSFDLQTEPIGNHNCADDECQSDTQ